MKEQWPYLTNYLKDGRLELSNNRAERSIKSFVIDRKNFLFANTPRGARESAVIFSMIQTALENGLDPYRYLTWLMKTASKTDLSDDENLLPLLPWNAPQDCRVWIRITAVAGNTPQTTAVVLYAPSFDAYDVIGREKAVRAFAPTALWIN